MSVDFTDGVEFYRASGEQTCSQCGKKYINHPMDHDLLDFQGYPYLHVLCNGERVKL